jgi:hypothetical protein
VPFEVLIERTGVESNLGAGPSRLRIPSFIEDSLSILKQMGMYSGILFALLLTPCLLTLLPFRLCKLFCKIDVSVEGIFRKNGNIRRLKELSEEIDRNPAQVNLANETPIQIAALLKKFLRELPEPLLTYKLYKLFVVSQSKCYDALWNTAETSTNFKLTTLYFLRARK